MKPKEAKQVPFGSFSKFLSCPYQICINPSSFRRNGKALLKKLQESKSLLSRPRQERQLRGARCAARRTLAPTLWFVTSERAFRPVRSVWIIWFPSNANIGAMQGFRPREDVCNCMDVCMHIENQRDRVRERERAVCV